MITDGYERCQQRMLPVMPSHERKLYHCDDSDKTYAEIRATGMIVNGTWAKKSRYGDEVNLDVFYCLFLSSSLLWISARYKWRRHGFLSPATGGGVSLYAGSAEMSP